MEPAAADAGVESRLIALRLHWRERAFQWGAGPAAVAFGGYFAAHGDWPGSVPWLMVALSFLLPTLMGRRRAAWLRLDPSGLRFHDGRRLRAADWRLIAKVQLHDEGWWPAIPPHLWIELATPEGYSVGWLTIPDIYDVPLARIAADMNAWRDRAPRPAGPMTEAEVAFVRGVAGEGQQLGYQFAMVMAMLPALLLIGTILWLAFR